MQKVESEFGFGRFGVVRRVQKPPLAALCTSSSCALSSKAVVMNVAASSAPSSSASKLQSRYFKSKGRTFSRRNKDLKTIVAPPACGGERTYRIRNVEDRFAPMSALRPNATSVKNGHPVARPTGLRGVGSDIRPALAPCDTLLPCDPAWQQLMQATSTMHSEGPPALRICSFAQHDFLCTR